MKDDRYTESNFGSGSSDLEMAMNKLKVVEQKVIQEIVFEQSKPD